MKSLSERVRYIIHKIPLSLLNSKVVENVQRLPRQTPLGIACSGGLDSVALFWILLAHFPERRMDFRLVHFNHRLRGDASDGDARFINQWGEELGVPVYIGAWENAPVLERVTEAEARQARHSYFDQLSQKEGIQHFFLAHHRDDVAENMLLRICRGSGLEGLTGPRPIQRFGDRWTALRPLMSISKADLKDLLEEMEIRWREDLTNQDPMYDRNALRLHVLPDLERILGNRFARGVALTHEILNDENEALDFYLEKTMGSRFEFQMDISPLRGHPLALWRRFFYRWLRQVDALSGLSRIFIEDFLHNMFEGQETMRILFDARILRFKEGWLGVEKPEKAILTQEWGRVRLPLNISCFIPYGGIVRCELMGLNEGLKQRILAGEVDVETEAFLDADLCPLDQLFIRQRKEGDQYRPLGAPGRKSLKKLFIDKKIPREERMLRPVFEAAGELLWVPGLPPAHAFCLKEESLKTLRLTYLPA